MNDDNQHPPSKAWVVSCLVGMAIVSPAFIAVGILLLRERLWILGAVFFCLAGFVAVISAKETFRQLLRL
jgi:hypothetical protein